MSMKQKWVVATEKRLIHEADCLGDLLEQIRGYVSPVLIGEQQWKRLVKRVYELPVTVAALPFGFEIPLHDPNPGADFGVSLVGGSRAAEFFKKADRTDTTNSTVAGIARFLDETDREESNLRRIVGRKMLLEYDIDSALPGTSPYPGIFLYPDGETFAHGIDGRQFKDISAMLDGVDSTVSRNPDINERRHVERVCRALEPDTQFAAAGTFPSRSRIARLTLMGFKKRHAVTEFLDRVDWPGQSSIVDTTLLRFDERNAYDRLGVHLDVNAAGVGPALGLSLYAQEGQWVKSGHYWAAIIYCMRDAGIAVPEKLSAVQEWAAGSESVSGKSGPFVMVRGIHHFKITLTGDQVSSVKGYIFVMLFSWPLDLTSSD